MGKPRIENRPFPEGMVTDAVRLFPVAGETEESAALRLGNELGGCFGERVPRKLEWSEEGPIPDTEYYRSNTILLAVKVGEDETWELPSGSPVYLNGQPKVSTRNVLLQQESINRLWSFSFSHFENYSETEIPGDGKLTFSYMVVAKTPKESRHFRKIRGW